MASLVEEVVGQVMAQTSRSAMATELLRHPTVLRNHLTVLRSLLMEHQNHPTELQPPLMMRRPQTATTPLSQTATTRHQAATKQADEGVAWNCQLKQGTSTPTSTWL